MRLKALVTVLLFASSIAYAGVLDDFNRPDAPTLGPNWTVQAGGGEIFNNTARALGSSQFPNLLTFNGFSGNSAFVDVFAVDSSLAYLALDLAYFDVNNNYFIKVQNQGCTGGACFNYGAFYYGNNGGGNFFPLTAEFTSGRITAFFTGTLATLEIDSNFDGIPDQTYSYNYGAGTGGTGIGLGLYGTAQADNFGSGAIPEPGTMLLLGTGITTLAAAFRRRMM